MVDETPGVVEPVTAPSATEPPEHLEEAQPEVAPVVEEPQKEADCFHFIIHLSHSLNSLKGVI